MIKLENINKYYNDNHVLNSINLEFLDGKIYVIKGISGCGKTTLLNIISGIDNNYEGNIYLNDAIIKNSDLKTNVSYIFQNSLLISNLNIYDNLLLISSDEDKIKYYAEAFNVINLFSKFPNQLSGGERQRIAIIRALLSDTKIIIADEPTSSLDKTSAINIVNELAKLRNDSRIIIIATHDKIFDDVADCIINLDYGKVGQIQNNQIKNNYNIKYEKTFSNNFKDIDRKYVNKKIKKNTRTTVILTTLLVLLLILIGIKDNFKKEALKIMEDKYPINCFDVLTQKLYLFENIENIKIYDNYFYQNEGIDFYSLTSYSDSIFKNKDVLYIGEFPQNNEVLITSSLAQEYGINNKNLEKIVLNNKEYTVSGIIKDDDSIIDLINSSNIYYNLQKNAKAVFMQEDLIKQFAPVLESRSTLISIENLYDNKAALDIINKNNIYLYWEEEINEYQYTIDLVFNILLILFVLSGIIAFLFINNEILYKLNLRKREIGYLQLFNISKKRIKNILIKEYTSTIFKTIVLAIIIFYLTSLCIFLIFNFNITPSLIKVVLLIFLLYIYILFAVKIPVNKILKKSIIDLISSN